MPGVAARERDALKPRVDKAKASWCGAAVLCSPERPAGCGRRGHLPATSASAASLGAALLPDGALTLSALEPAKKVQRHAARVALGAFQTTRTWMTQAGPGLAAGREP